MSMGGTISQTTDHLYNVFFPFWAWGVFCFFRTIHVDMPLIFRMRFGHGINPCIERIYDICIVV